MRLAPGGPPRRNVSTRAGEGGLGIVFMVLITPTKSRLRYAPQVSPRKGTRSNLRGPARARRQARKWFRFRNVMMPGSGTPAPTSMQFGLHPSDRPRTDPRPSRVANSTPNGRRLAIAEVVVTTEAIDPYWEELERPLRQRFGKRQQVSLIARQNDGCPSMAALLKGPAPRDGIGPCCGNHRQRARNAASAMLQMAKVPASGRRRHRSPVPASATAWRRLRIRGRLNSPSFVMAGA